MKKGLSLVIPCYREEGHLNDSYLKISTELKRLKIPYEIIFVEDCSPDKTKEILKKIVSKDKKTKAIFHKFNVGRGGSVMDGIRLAKYDYVGFLDVDLEVSEKYISNFVKKLEDDNDVVIGKRKYLFTFKSIPRIIASRGYVYLVRMLLGLPFDDTEAGYKFFKREKILPILSIIQDKKWFWDTEIIAVSYCENLKIIEVPVVFQRRLDKKSTVKLFEDSLEYIKRIMSFKKNQIFSSSGFKLIRYYKSSRKGVIYLFFKILFFPLAEMEKMLPKAGRIIDLGCGEGLLINMLSLKPFNRDLVGIDSDKKRLEIARSTVGKRKKISFITADLNKFNLPICDAIVASDFLHHLSFKDQEKLLVRCYKSLNSSGMLLIKDVDRDSGLRHILSRLADEILYQGKERGNFGGANDWAKLLKRIGFNVNSKQTAEFSPFSTILITAIK